MCCQMLSCFAGLKCVWHVTVCDCQGFAPNHDHDLGTIAGDILGLIWAIWDQWVCSQLFSGPKWYRNCYLIPKLPLGGRRHFKSVKGPGWIDLGGQNAAGKLLFHDFNVMCVCQVFQVGKDVWCNELLCLMWCVWDYASLTCAMLSFT